MTVHTHHFLLLFVFISFCYGNIVVDKFIYYDCNGLGPGNDSCYFQTAYNTRDCSVDSPCSRLFLYFCGGGMSVQDGNYDNRMNWWANQGYATGVFQPFNSSDEAGKYPYFMEYARLSFMVQQARDFYTSGGLWTGEYLVVAGISHGATAPPISIAHNSGFKTSPNTWTGSISTAVVLFDGISNPSAFDDWLSLSPSCYFQHGRTVARYGDGYPLEHSCNNHKCYCSNPSSKESWINDTLVIGLEDPLSPYTCDSITLSSGKIYWYIVSCEGEGRPACGPYGDYVPSSQQSGLFNSIQQCTNIISEYYVDSTCGHSACGSTHCGASKAQEFLDSVWGNSYK